MGVRVHVDMGLALLIDLLVFQLKEEWKHKCSITLDTSQEVKL